LLAQYYDDPGLGQKPVATHPQDYKPLGIRAGSFMLHPGVELAAEYTDNVFYSYDNEESDLIWHVRPYFTAQSTWSRHSFNVRLAADIGRHADYGFRDYEDYFLNISGRLDVKTRTSITYGADYMDLHEGLNVRSAEQGVEPTRFTIYGGRLGFDHIFNRFSVGMMYRRYWYDFDDALGEDGTIIENQDRDRVDDSLSAKVAYQFKTDKQLFARATWYQTEFDQPFDRNGLDRSSDGWSVSAGITFQVTGVLDGDLAASYYSRSVNDPLLPDIEGWGGSAGLSWYPTSLTTVRGSISTEVHPTTSQYSSGYLGTLYAVRVDHELLRDLQVQAHVSYRDNDYQLVDFAPEDARRYDEVWSAGLGASWFINRNLRLSASYDFSTLSTNVPFDGYDANRFWLVLGFEK
jgi:hypothetical protein